MGQARIGLLRYACIKCCLQQRLCIGIHRSSGCIGCGQQCLIGQGRRAGVKRAAFTSLLQIFVDLRIPTDDLLIQICLLTNYILIDTTLVLCNLAQCIVDPCGKRLQTVKKQNILQSLPHRCLLIVQQHGCPVHICHRQVHRLIQNGKRLLLGQITDSIFFCPTEQDFGILIVGAVGDAGLSGVISSPKQDPLFGIIQNIIFICVAANIKLPFRLIVQAEKVNSILCLKGPWSDGRRIGTVLQVPLRNVNGNLFPINRNIARTGSR